MNFVKYHGLGNDFVFINNLNQKELLFTPKQCILVCDRNFGIGADGVVFVSQSETMDYKMTIINSDGSEAEMCGNATRCLAKYLGELENVTQKTYSIETKAGKICPTLDGENVTVDMNTPKLESKQIPTSLNFGDKLQIDGQVFKTYCVSMGNPHCVLFVENFDFNWQEIGSKIEKHPSFPAKTNVHFAKVVGAQNIAVKVWERGAGVTLACGTGACAVTVAAILTGKIKEKSTIHLQGGDLQIAWNGDANSSVFMTGPATKVFEGQIEL